MKKTTTIKRSVKPKTKKKTTKKRITIPTIADKIKEYRESEEVIYYLLQCPNCLEHISTNTILEAICSNCLYPIKIEEPNIIDCCTETELDSWHELKELKEGEIILN